MANPVDVTSFFGWSKCDRERCVLLLPSNFLGVRARNAEVQTAGGSLVRRRLAFLIALPKNSFAALIERVAATLLQALEQRLHYFKPLHPFAELRDFPLGELLPALRGTHSRGEPEKQLAYFLQAEPRLSSVLHHC